MYGPTETTIWSTTWPLDGDLDVVPIGTPIANTQIYVLDDTANRSHPAWPVSCGSAATASCAATTTVPS